MVIPRFIWDWFSRKMLKEKKIELSVLEGIQVLLPTSTGNPGLKKKTLRYTSALVENFIFGASGSDK